MPNLEMTPTEKKQARGALVLVIAVLKYAMNEEYSPEGAIQAGEAFADHAEKRGYSLEALLTMTPDL